PEKPSRPEITILSDMTAISAVICCKKQAEIPATHSTLMLRKNRLIVRRPFQGLNGVAPAGEGTTANRKFVGSGHSETSAGAIQFHPPPAYALPTSPPAGSCHLARQPTC